MLGFQADDAAFEGGGHGGGAVGDTELIEDVEHVALDGSLANPELFSDILVARTARHEFEYLDLSGTQPLLVGASHALHEASCNSGVQGRFALCNHPDGPEELLTWSVFQQVAGGSRLDGS